jgi:hypothetical protein
MNSAAESELVNETLALFVAEMDTVQLIGVFVVNDAGIRKPTARLAPVVFVMNAAGIVTGDPLPGGGVIVTWTLDAVIVPVNPVPAT